MTCSWHVPLAAEGQFMWTKVVLGCLCKIPAYSSGMDIDSLKRKLKIVGIEEVRRLSQAELAGWNILSIRDRMSEPLSFPGARSRKSLHFDDVEADYPEDAQFAARLEDLQAALAFSRGIEDEPLLIHCT